MSKPKRVRLIVETKATATIEERWVIEVPAARARELLDNGGDDIVEYIHRDGHETVSVENTAVYDEEDRIVTNVTRGREE